jgi:hypothetical protein
VSEPVRKQIRVRRTAERAFDVFTRCIDQRFIRAWGQVLPAFESFVSQLSTPEA